MKEVFFEKRMDGDGKNLMEIAEWAGVDNHLHPLKKIIRSMMEEGLVEFTVPDRPNSRNQKYRATAKGRRSIP